MFDFSNFSAGACQITVLNNKIKVVLHILMNSKHMPRYIAKELLPHMYVLQHNKLKYLLCC